MSKRILAIAAFALACPVAVAAPPENTTGSYCLEVREARTLPGLGPPGTWLSVMILFPEEPTRDAAYDAIIAETQRLAARGLDADVFVSVGTFGRLMLDRDGAPVFADYNTANKTLRRGSQLLRQIP
jgi:hypothetical protein